MFGIDEEQVIKTYDEFIRLIYIMWGINIARRDLFKLTLYIDKYVDREKHRIIDIEYVGLFGGNSVEIDIGNIKTICNNTFNAVYVCDKRKISSSISMIYEYPSIELPIYIKNIVDKYCSKINSYVEEINKYIKKIGYSSLDKIKINKEIGTQLSLHDTNNRTIFYIAGKEIDKNIWMILRDTYSNEVIETKILNDKVNTYIDIVSENSREYYDLYRLYIDIYNKIVYMLYYLFKMLNEINSITIYMFT